MRDIEEDIKDYEMDDYEENRGRKVRDYSFSPTKTPSKRGRDALNDKKYKKFRNQTLNNFGASRYGNSDKTSFYSIQSYKQHPSTKDSISYDIENFKMIDQPNYDGIDKNITLWCT